MTRHSRTPFFASATILFALFICLGPFGSGIAHASTTITTCTQLQNIGSTTGPLSGSYVLGGNIDCSATATWNPNGGGGYYGFSPIGDFTGTFNGAGYTISNLYISTTTNNVGLFSTLDATSTVQNLTLSGGSISGASDVGTVAGQMIATSTVQNVTSSMSVTGTAITGGLVGFMHSASTTITNSSESGAVSVSANSANSVGGLVGDVLGGTISSSFATGSVTANGSSDQYIGGLVGFTSSSSPVSNSYDTGTVIASGAGDEYVGGLIGESGAAVTNTYETGSVTANGSGVEYVGGLIGDNASGAIASSSASGAVTALGASSDYLAGFVGFSNAAITTSFATGAVTATTTSSYVGGFDGSQDVGAITKCYATGNITAGGYSVGGFAGASEDTISQSFSTGNITVVSGATYAEYVGGFAGYSTVAIDDDYSTGNISIPASPNNNVYYVGGFDGGSSQTITNSYSTGNINGPGAYGDVGGFVGYNSYPVINSFSTGAGSAFLLSTTTGYTGYFEGEIGNGAIPTNDAVFVQGTPAIGDDHNFGNASDALLATHGYGTDESTLSNFYSTTEPVYAQATSTPWNFTSIWETHPNTFPTFQWYSGVTPSYTITATAGTGGTINNSGASSVLSGANKSYTITPNSGYTIASVLVDGTSVGAVSTYTFSNVATNHTISVTFTANAPTPTVTSSGGGSSGGGDVPNQVSNLLQGGNTAAAAALIKQYPSIFPTGSVATVVSSSAAGSATSASSGVFTRALTLGSTGADVMALQKYLNTHGFVVATSGAGSAGNETIYFGKATRAALANFQKAKGISPAVGYFGSITRAYVLAHS